MQAIIAEVNKNSREIVRLTLQEFKGLRLLDIRVYASRKDGQVVPTRQGVCIQVSMISQLLEALRKALEAADAQPKERGVLL